ncbi:MAG: redox-sensing transcriptional repressor Rex [Bacillota bacterium]|nr:redox-sensing transcriptional repressor Rex [Bacillota bacterium]
MANGGISKQTIERLMLYANYLRSLPEGGPPTISATHIGEQLGLNQVVVRKDLAEVSDGGRPKIGYVTSRLLADIEHALGYDNVNSAVLVGAGNLGRALMSYDGFRNYGVEIVLALDTNQSLAGQSFGNVPVMPLDRLENLMARMKLHIGIITVPAKVAQEVCDRLTAAGIKAIWNFSSINLSVPPDVMVRNENMAVSLSMLSQHLAASMEKV